jgi:hypothetical protein
LCITLVIYQDSKLLHETAWLYMLFKLEVMTHHLVVWGSSLHSHCHSFCPFHIFHSLKSYGSFLMHVLSSWESSDFSTTDNATTPFWARRWSVTAGQFPEPPRPGSQLPHPTSLTTPLSRVTLGSSMWVTDQRAISSTCVNLRLLTLTCLIMEKRNKLSHPS